MAITGRHRADRLEKLARLVKIATAIARLAELIKRVL
jgi:hypothetical protein